MNVQSKNKLVWNAVPTKFAVPNPPPSCSSKRKAPALKVHPPPKKKKKVSSPPQDGLTGMQKHDGFVKL